MSGEIFRYAAAALAALGALCGLAAPSHAAATPTRAKAAIVEPLSLINTASLSFGDFAAGTAAGSVVVTPLGARTVTGGVTALGGTVGAASFTGAASGLNLVVIRYPEVPVTLLRQGGGGAMSISAFTIEGGRFRLFTARQAFEFRVGGTLQVGAAQREGSYQGEFEVTIDYF